MSENRHELFPGVYANEEQSLAIDQIQTFLKSKVKRDEYFTLIGKAGTGKTTVLRKALETAKGSVIVGAMTHKAKEIVERSIGNTRYKYYSLASMLGMRLNLETGKFTVEYDERGDPPITSANVIVIDECSMINEEALRLILEMKLPSAKLIFIGDSNQLAPIRESDSKHIGEISPVFQNERKYTLLQRMRQGEDSSILPYADYYWNNACSKEAIVDPVPEKARKDSKELKFIPMNKILPKTIKLFREAVTTRNPDLIRFICYRNTTRIKLNQLLRYEIFDDPDTFEKDEILMLFDTYRTKSLTTGEDIKLENSQELFVNSIIPQAREVEGRVFNIFYLNVSFTHKGRQQNAHVEVLDPLEKEEYDALVTQLFKQANDIPKTKGYERRMAYMKAYAVRNKFAKADYAYAITVHKSQGSSYNEVIVYEGDIMGIGASSEREKSQAMYVAITRARNKCYIVT